MVAGVGKILKIKNRIRILRLWILRITDPWITKRIRITDHGEDPWSANPFLGSNKIVRNWTENEISAKLADVIELPPLEIGMALLITPTSIF